MRDAYREGGQPCCVRCGHPLDKIVEPDVERIVWTYSKRLKAYKMKIEASGNPYHDCSICDDGCAAGEGVQEDIS